MHMVEGEDPLDCLGRVDNAAHELAAVSVLRRSVNTAYNMLKTIAARHRLKRELDTIHMLETTHLIISAIDKAADGLAVSECSKSIEEINQHVIQNA